MKERVILHVDMNNFYASVECIDKPELKKVPMAVAGDPLKRHGIILAKNGIAKAKGVTTGEAIWISKQKCPDLVLCAPHYDKYEYYSKKAFEIYSRYTDQVEGYGLDECWLDVTGSDKLFGSGTDIAQKIMNDIKNELSLTVSVGVSFNKIFAKLGSDMKKPDAMTEISREKFKEIVWDLPAGELLFVGKSTKKTLEKYGILTIGDIAETDKDFLYAIFGKMGTQLWESANGLDNSEVAQIGLSGEMKSISNSTTTAQDLQNDEDVKKVLYSLSEKVAHRLRSKGVFANSLHLSVRLANLEHFQKSVSLDFSTASSDAIFNEVYKMYKQNKSNESIRSLGIRAEKLSHESVVQLSLFEEKNDDKSMKLEQAKDLLRSKYGLKSIQRALLIEKNTEKTDKKADNA